MSDDLFIQCPECGGAGEGCNHCEQTGAVWNESHPDYPAEMERIDEIAGRMSRWVTKYRLPMLKAKCSACDGPLAPMTYERWKQRLERFGLDGPHKKCTRCAILSLMEGCK